MRALSWQPPISPMDMTLFMNEKREDFMGILNTILRYFQKKLY